MRFSSRRMAGVGIGLHDDLYTRVGAKILQDR